jgi:hypothetical protein
MDCNLFEEWTYFWSKVLSKNNMETFFRTLLPNIWESLALFEGSLASYVCRPEEIRMNVVTCMKHW